MQSSGHLCAHWLLHPKVCRCDPSPLSGPSSDAGSPPLRARSLPQGKRLGSAWQMAAARQARPDPVLLMSVSFHEKPADSAWQGQVRQQPQGSAPA